MQFASEGVLANEMEHLVILACASGVRLEPAGTSEDTQGYFEVGERTVVIANTSSQYIL